MKANQAAFPVSTMARMLGVSKAGYYAWLRRPPCAHAEADAALLKRVRTIHATSRHTLFESRFEIEEMCSAPRERARWVDTGAQVGVRMSQPRSLLSIARSNMARSRMRFLLSSQNLMAQTCCGFKARLAPSFRPAFHAGSP